MGSKAFIARVVAVAMSRCVQSSLPKTDRLAPQPHYTDDAHPPQPSAASHRSKFGEICTALSVYNYSRAACIIHDRCAHCHNPSSIVSTIHIMPTQDMDGARFLFFALFSCFPLYHRCTPKRVDSLHQNRKPSSSMYQTSPGRWLRAKHDRSTPSRQQNQHQV
jgi:hypothetical protein